MRTEAGFPNRQQQNKLHKSLDALRTVRKRRRTRLSPYRAFPHTRQTARNSRACRLLGTLAWPPIAGIQGKGPSLGYRASSTYLPASNFMLRQFHAAYYHNGLLSATLAVLFVTPTPKALSPWSEARRIPLSCLSSRSKAATHSENKRGQPCQTRSKRSM